MRYNLRLYMVTSALFALPFVALAQENAPTTPIKTTEDVPLIRVEEQGDPGLTFDWQLRPRTPIQFTPFEMVDPNTGEPVNADDIIDVGGVKMTAGEFYRRLNEAEQWLNAHGYSLRKDTEFEYYSPQLEMEIADSEQRLRDLEAQLPLSGEPAGSDFSPAACTDGSRSFDTGWFGNSLFGVRIRGQGGYRACLSPVLASVQGNARLDGRLAGFERTVVSATASASVSTDNIQASRLNYRYSVNVEVLGNTVWGPSDSGRTEGGLTFSWNWQIAAIDWHSSTIRLGCVRVLGINVCLNGRVGVRGRLSLAAAVGLSVSRQHASAHPYGNLHGYAEAWIGVNAGILRAEAGVRGNLTFFSGELGGESRGNFSQRNRCVDYTFTTRLVANLTALSGNVQAYVRGCIWFLGWRCATARMTLFSWSGISWSRELGYWSRTVTVGCL